MKWPLFAVPLVALSTGAACLAASYGSSADAAAVGRLQVWSTTEADARRTLGEPDATGTKGALRWLAYDRSGLTLAVDGKHTVVGVARGGDAPANQCGRRLATTN